MLGYYEVQKALSPLGEEVVDQENPFFNRVENRYLRSIIHPYNNVTISPDFEANHFWMLATVLMYLNYATKKIGSELKPEFSIFKRKEANNRISDLYLPEGLNAVIITQLNDLSFESIDTRRFITKIIRNEISVMNEILGTQGFIALRLNPHGTHSREYYYIHGIKPREI